MSQYGRERESEKSCWRRVGYLSRFSHTEFCEWSGKKEQRDQLDRIERLVQFSVIWASSGYGEGVWLAGISSQLNRGSFIL